MGSQTSPPPSSSLLQSHRGGDGKEREDRDSSAVTAEQELLTSDRRSSLDQERATDLKESLNSSGLEKIEGDGEEREVAEKEEEEEEKEEDKKEKKEETADNHNTNDDNHTRDTTSASSSPSSAQPPLPDEEEPPLPPEEELEEEEAKQIQQTEQTHTNIPVDDGWAPIWDDTAQQYYFYNRFTELTQWENPRVPDNNADGAGTTATTTTTKTALNAAGARAPLPDQDDGDIAYKSSIAGGYNPAIHGDYDPTAPYAQQYKQDEEGDWGGGNGVGSSHLADPSLLYTAAGTLNRFTGRWQGADFPAGPGPDRFDEESRRKRQLDAFFDVDAAANSHNGRSLRAERSAKKLSKKELKEFNKKRKERKEEKRRAWLRD